MEPSTEHVVWKLRRIGRNLREVNRELRTIAYELAKRSDKTKKEE